MIENENLLIDGCCYAVRTGSGVCTEGEVALMLELLHREDVVLTGFAWGEAEAETFTDEVDNDALVDAAFALLEQLRPQAGV